VSLDTNTVLELFNRRGRVAERLLAAAAAAIAVPSVVLYELEVGVRKSKRPKIGRRQADELMAAVALLPFGSEEARVAAGIRADLGAKGLEIGPYDTLIAATALARGAVLVTHDSRELGRIDRLRTEDWSRPRRAEDDLAP